ncbi:MAG: 3-phosphoshikimate 1-carboxyvinyltransferase [Pseudomonadota bacterium]
MKEIKPRSSINGTVRIPGSKSITHRALIAAGLAKGESLIEDPLFCEDTLYTIDGLRALGIQIVSDRDSAKVLGTGGEFIRSTGIRDIYLGNSGTSYRLLLSTVAIAKGDYIVTGSPRMRERPIGELIRVLNELGVDASCVGRSGFPPVFIKAKGILGGKVEIKGNESSQFVSSLLLAGPCSERGMEIHVKGPLVSRPYIDITLTVMERFGVTLDREGYHYFKIPSGQRYKPVRFVIEGDVSNASYFWASAAVTGGTMVTENISPHITNQGDVAFLNLLEEMGCRVERGRNQVVVHGGPLSGIDVDMGNMPDMVPTLTAIALFADGKTSIRNISHLRHKESDRIRCVARELGRLGGRLEEQPDGLVIHGGGHLSGAILDPHNDHRLAMSFAVIGLRVPGIRIKDENCVTKSFPGFWKLWERIRE